MISSLQQTAGIFTTLENQGFPIQVNSVRNAWDNFKQAEQLVFSRYSLLLV